MPAAPAPNLLPWQKGPFDTSVKRSPRQFIAALKEYYEGYDDWLSL